MTASARFFRWHRWLAWLVALQVLAWVVGGFVFTWVPFKTWVKAEDVMQRPQPALPADWAAQLARRLEQQPTAPVLALSSVLTPQGPALRLRHAEGATWLDARGEPLAPPDAAAVARFAGELYRGAGALVDVQRLAEAPVRALIVREAGDRRDVWRVRFDDTLGTRLYFDTRSGELLAVRNDAWVVYDFFWRLHLMDYGGGEDFNHPLVRAASLLALALVATGLVLATLALRRVWRRRALHRAGHA